MHDSPSAGKGTIGNKLYSAPFFSFLEFVVMSVTTRPFQAFSFIDVVSADRVPVQGSF